MTLPDTYDLVLRGLRDIRESHDVAETGKLGTLRAGNTGVLLSDGTIVGKCARLTYLRLIGIDAGDDDASRELMFGAGTSNEDRWYDMLVRGGFPAECLLREGETPISWQLPSGRWVTGRPDIVLCDKVVGAASVGQQVPYYIPRRLIELKQVSSLWTARDVLFGKGPTKSEPTRNVPPQPKSMHLMQAAHYAWQLDCPGELWYTSRSDFHVPYGGFPKPGELGSEYIGYVDGSKPFKVLPFLIGYGLEWRGGNLYFRKLATGSTRPKGPWVKSLVTKQGILDYYQLVDKLDQEGMEELPPRPTNILPDSNSEGSSPCDWCTLAETCTRSERKGKTVWVSEARAILAKVMQTGSIHLK